MIRNSLETFNRIIILCLVCISFESYTQDSDSTKLDLSQLNDGPYVLIEEDKLIEKNIIEGNIQDFELGISDYEIDFTPDSSSYRDVKKIAAFSDIHGQFDLALEILINNKIIDKDLNWTFGKGHLVIVGDIFDRGDQVTEALWFVYELEKKAIEKGGKVLFLLGNHEYMVLRNDLRYLNEKYNVVSEMLAIPYNKLYSNNTVLGRWLRSKPTMIKIDKNLFVHAGISPEFLAQGTDLDGINKKMRESIDVDKQTLKDSSFYQIYYGSDGPIWYRGYFRDKIEEEEVDEILKVYAVEHIIVGHTSQKKVKKEYHKKVIAVDSSIKKGKNGELLIIKKNSYYRCTKEGKRIKLR